MNMLATETDTIFASHNKCKITFVHFVFDIFRMVFKFDFGLLKPVIRSCAIG